MIHALVLAALAARLDGAHILNSGSTNAPPYEILVWSDGNARTLANGRSHAVRIGVTLARTFLTDAKRARGENASVAPCIKSASFGTRSTVTYHGWHSPDVSCHAQGALAALAADVASIVRLAQPMGARRIMLPPNEPRRVPESTPAPSPTPTS